MNALKEIDTFALSLLRIYKDTAGEGIKGSQIEQMAKKLAENNRWSMLLADTPPLCEAILAFAIAEQQFGSSEIGDPFRNGITIENVCFLMGGAPGASISFGTLRKVYEWAHRFLLVSCDARPFYQHRIQADERLLAFLAGEDLLDLRLMADGVSLMEGDRSPLYVGEQTLQRLTSALSVREGLIQLAGSEGSGRKFLLRHACRTLGLTMLEVNYLRLAGRSRAEAEQIGTAIAREACLSAAGVCFAGLTAANCPDRAALFAFFQDYLQPLAGNPYPVCVCTDPSTEMIAPLACFVEKVVFPELTRTERMEMWQGLTKEMQLGDSVDCVEVASKFKLSPGEIRKAALRLVELRKCGQQIDSATVGATCVAVLPPPVQGSIKLVQVHYTLDDLKLPARQKQTLKNICAHLTQRHRVYDEWNMESRFAYGKNVSALFVGPPGTGKTMAVYVLSTMMGLPLYRIDLSQVVDKYIGETEKHLEEIFTAAEKSNSILFFDEADSIFGKRSEVNDSKDKYANTEVSYILQRIEQYDGVVILATNYKKNIDEAFMRRMRYLVEFMMPDEKLRRELWETSFAPEVPLVKVDFAFLARQFEFSGGAIKNISLNAAFLAADEGRAVFMKDILDSIRSENLKLGKTMLAQDFAEYGDLQR